MCSSSGLNREAIAGTRPSAVRVCHSTRRARCRFDLAAAVYASPRHGNDTGFSTDERSLRVTDGDRTRFLLVHDQMLYRLSFNHQATQGTLDAATRQSGLPVTAFEPVRPFRHGILTAPHLPIPVRLASPPGERTVGWGHTACVTPTLDLASANTDCIKSIFRPVRLVSAPVVRSTWTNTPRP
jgi:hypothetical protein